MSFAPPHTGEIRTAKAPGLPDIHRPQCACGWCGEITEHRDDAEQELEKHMEMAANGST